MRLNKFGENIGLLFGVLLVASAWMGPSPAEGGISQSRADSLEAAYDRVGKEDVFDPSTAGLDDYLRFAALHSPALKAAFYEWRAALSRSGYAGALPDPQFSYTRFIEHVETRVGPQNQVFRLRQDFPWFGTLGAKKDVSLQTANAAFQKFEAARLKLFYDVQTAFYEYYFLGRGVDITRENLELLTFWESIARAKYRVGLKRHPDVIKAQVELGKLEDQLRTLEDAKEPAAARLRAAVGLPNGVLPPVPAEIEIPETAVDGGRVTALALAHNPDLKSLVHMIDQTRAVRRLAGKSSWPSFFAGVDYIDIGEAVNPGVPESGKDAFTATVGVSLPLWFGANKAKRQEAGAQYKKALNDYDNAQIHLAALTEKIVFDYKNALRKTRLYRDGLIPKAKQSLETSYTAYQSGEADFLDVLDAQRQLLDFQLQYERFRSNLAVSRAEIEKITGTDFAESAGE